MCVICVSKEGAVPSKDDLQAMRDHNDDGIGIAWQPEPHADILFERGIDMRRLLQITQIIAAEKMPYVLHFRFATIGGVHRRLCHPYPISTNQSVLFAHRGKVPYVLAHNGHWSKWEEEVAVPPRVKRQGQWSDSAAIAYIAAAEHRIIVPSGHKIATLHHEEGIKTFGYFVERKMGGGKVELSNVAWDHSYSTTTVYGSYGFGGNSQPQGGWRSMGRENKRWNNLYDASEKMYPQCNRFRCEHDKLYSCADCIPTLNRRPVEVLPKEQPKWLSDADWKNIHFTHRTNGIPLTSSYHGCTHFDHWHCGECNNSGCPEARTAWAAVKAKTAAEKDAATDVCKVEASKQQSLPVKQRSQQQPKQSGGTVVPLSQTSKSLQRLMARNGHVAAIACDPDCSSPQICQDWPCKLCSSYRRLHSLPQRRKGATYIDGSHRNGNSSRLIAVNQVGRRVDAVLCLHEKTMQEYCAECNDSYEEIKTKEKKQ